MLAKKTFYITVMALLLLNGCGNKDKTETSTTDGTYNNGGSYSQEYSYKVINNRGEDIKSKIGEYDISLYSNYKEVADDKSPHKGVIVKLNEKESELMAIQASYIGKEIKARVYKDNELITTTEPIEVTDDNPIVKIDIEI